MQPFENEACSMVDNKQPRDGEKYKWIIAYDLSVQII